MLNYNVALLETPIMLLCQVDSFLISTVTLFGENNSLGGLCFSCTSVHRLIIVHGWKVLILSIDLFSCGCHPLNSVPILGAIRVRMTFYTDEVQL